MSAPYDVENPPAPEAWLAMDESERIALVEEAHRRTNSPVGQNPHAHATIHVTVENRLAAKHGPVVAAYDRFRAAGINRHTTVHALASVVARHMMDILERREDFDQETADRDFDALDPNAFKRKR
ncbi:hypothetical protein AKJ09_06066 [Labilithrix luteola]|uniref:Uncharacterized protein n=1 Tax=Labilithrix luteola TaxID=1391654 RepID=A0A0K1Q0Y9_9BACT|nr:hypothetical protein [Labilithrix luteola]AKU99402.1 hypothetical protein AKJ09_06066 [Labilithrix luteola]